MTNKTGRLILGWCALFVGLMLAPSPAPGGIAIAFGGAALLLGVSPAFRGMVRSLFRSHHPLAIRVKRFLKTIRRKR